MLCEHIFQIGWSHQLEFTVFCSPTTKDYLGKGFAFKWATYAYLGNPATIGWNGGMVVSANEHTWSLWLRRPRLTIPLVSHQACIPLQTNVRMWHGRFPTKFILHQYPKLFACTRHRSRISHVLYIHNSGCSIDAIPNIYRIHASMLTLFTYVSVYSSIHDWCIWSLPTSFMLLSGHPCSHPAIWLSIVLGKL